MDASISSPSSESRPPNDGKVDRSMILEESDKLSCEISSSNDDPSDAIKSDGGGDSVAKGIGDADQKIAIDPDVHKSPRSAEKDDGQLGSRVVEQENRPMSPTTAQEDIVVTQVTNVSESIDRSSEQLITSPSVVDEDSKQEIGNTYEDQTSKKTETQEEKSSSTSDLQKVTSHGMGDGRRQQVPQEINLNEVGADSRPTNHQGNLRPLWPTANEATYPPVRTHDSVNSIVENYRASAHNRLSCVVEESESFARREFGENDLRYMSTHGSADHSTNLASLHLDEPVLSSKHGFFGHNNYHQFNYNLRISREPSNAKLVKYSKSAPSGMATRTGSAFGLFRRGASESSGLRMRKRTVYRPSGPRKPKNLASTLMWPLVKIKNKYVGCMMGLEGTGDLRGMAQGGTFGDSGWYFADVPLSKSDIRNFG